MKIGTGLYIKEKEILEQELFNYKNNIVNQYQYKNDVKFQWFEYEVLITWISQGYCMDDDETITETINLTVDQIETIKAFEKLIQYYS